MNILIELNFDKVILLKQYLYLKMNNYNFRHESSYKYTQHEREENQPSFSTAELLVKCMEQHKKQEELQSWLERRTMHEQMREARERFVSSLDEDNRRLQEKIVTIRSRMDEILHDLHVLRDSVEG